MTDQQYTAARNAIASIDEFSYRLRESLKQIPIPFGTSEFIMLQLGYLENRKNELEQEFPHQSKSGSAAG